MGKVERGGGKFRVPLIRRFLEHQEPTVQSSCVLCKSRAVKILETVDRDAEESATSNQVFSSYKMIGCERRWWGAVPETSDMNDE